MKVRVKVRVRVEVRVIEDKVIILVLFCTGCGPERSFDFFNISTLEMKGVCLFHTLIR